MDAGREARKPDTVGSRWLLPVALLLALSAVPVWPREPLQEGRDYVVVVPAERWRAPQWPVVTLVIEPGGDLAGASRSYAGLTSGRGALLLAIEGGDVDRVLTALDRVRESYSVRTDVNVLVGRDAMAAWAREQVLRLPDVFSGLVTIDDPGRRLEIEDQVRRTMERVRQAACLLVVDAAKAIENRAAQGQLLEHGLAAALREVRPEQLFGYLGGAFDALLPSAPPRFELFDEVTNATLKAPPGWQFLRHDRFFAIARPIGEAGGPRVEVATGGLGHRSFDGYVEATLKALSAADIELVESLRLTPADTPVAAQSYRFVDRRGGPGRTVYWIQVGRDRDLVSFRAVGPPGSLDDRIEPIREMALSVRFPEPEPAAEPPPSRPASRAESRCASPHGRCAASPTPHRPRRRRR